MSQYSIGWIQGCNTGSGENVRADLESVGKVCPTVCVDDDMRQRVSPSLSRRFITQSRMTFSCIRMRLNISNLSRHAILNPRPDVPNDLLCKRDAQVSHHELELSYIQRVLAVYGKQVKSIFQFLYATRVSVESFPALCDRLFDTG